MKSVKILVPRMGLAVIGCPIILNGEGNICAGVAAYEAFTLEALEQCLMGFQCIIRPNLKEISGFDYTRDKAAMEVDFYKTATSPLSRVAGEKIVKENPPPYAFLRYGYAESKLTPASLPTRSQPWVVRLSFSKEAFFKIPQELEHLIRVVDIEGQLLFSTGNNTFADAQAIAEWAKSEGIFESMKKVDRFSLDEAQYG